MGKKKAVVADSEPVTAETDPVVEPTESVEKESPKRQRRDWQKDILGHRKFFKLKGRS